MINHIFKYEWLAFCRNPFHIGIFCLTFLFGLYSVWYGNQEIGRQREAIRLMKAELSRQQRTTLKGLTADTTTQEGKKAWQLAAVPSYMWHRMKYAAFAEPGKLSALSLGQRDLQPYYYKLSAMSLYYQLFQNEIANPDLLHIGGFDLSFVVIYIFPLLIIAFCYSALSAEKDAGILPLLRAQPISLRRFALIRLSFYFLLVSGLAIVLSITGIVCSGSQDVLPLTESAQWLSVVLAYLAFWFSVLVLLISFNLHAGATALSGIGAWLVFLIVIPACLNIFIAVYQPLNTATLTGISRRAGVFDEEKDENQIRVIREFVGKYPQYNTGPGIYKYQLPAKGFAAFTVLNDDRSARLVQAYHQRVETREQLARELDLINPAVNMQGAFNCIAQTDLGSFRSFYHSVKEFHGQLVGFYYPKLFADQAFKPGDYRNLPVFNPVRSTTAGRLVCWSLLEIVGSAMLIFFTGFYRLGRGTGVN